MIRKINFLFLVMIVALLSCSKSKDLTKSNSNAALNKATLEKALLWEISGNDLQQSSYLYGTIHIIDSKDYFLPKGALTAFDQADQVVFEIDMTEMSDMSSMSGAMSMLDDLFMKDNLTLKELLTDAEYQQVNKRFGEMGLPMFMFERMKPMFLTMFTSEDMDPTGLQTGALKSYEMELMEMAKQASKPVSGLETIAFQISIFDKIPYKDQAKMLMESLNAGDQASNEFAKMVKIYKEQDIEAMVQMIQSDDAGMAEHEDVLLTERNQNWIPIMSDKMKKGSVFFAVGAGHLAGKNGVINLLKKQGYKLIPLSKQEVNH